MYYAACSSNRLIKMKVLLLVREAERPRKGNIKADLTDQMANNKFSISYKSLYSLYYVV